MSLIGHLIALAGLYALYTNGIIIGGILFFLGGFLARKLSFCFRSSGVMLMLLSTAYGFHNEYTPTIFFLIFMGFVLACFNTRRSSSNDNGGWGFDIDLSSSGSGSDSCGGGDSGGGGGGGGD